MTRDPRCPPGIPPERLWRSLLPLRPRLALEHRLACAPACALSVVPVPWVAEALALDAHAGVALDDVRKVRQVRARVALTLHAGGVLAFTDEADLGALGEREFAALAAAVSFALADIGPTYARSDTKAWLRVLEEGARHPSNRGAASVLASCADYTSGGWTARLDRYWGVSVADLLDGHWMVFDAARKASKA